jgi:hypothetical protein
VRDLTCGVEFDLLVVCGFAFDPHVNEEVKRYGTRGRGLSWWAEPSGSHRSFVHPRVSKPITISGAFGDDAKHYQVRAVKRAVEESKS